MVNLFHFYVNILLCYTFLLEFVYPVLLDRSFCLFICLFVHLFLSNFRIDFPGGSVVKNLPAKCRRCGFDPWIGKIPWRREWQLTPIFLPEKFHGQRSLADYSSWGCKELDMTKLLTHTHTHTHTHHVQF